MKILTLLEADRILIDVRATGKREKSQSLCLNLAYAVYHFKITSEISIFFQYCPCSIYSKFIKLIFLLHSQFKSNEKNIFGKEFVQFAAFSLQVHALFVKVY